MRKIALVQPSALLRAIVLIGVLFFYALVGSCIMSGEWLLGTTLTGLLVCLLMYQAFNEVLKLHVTVFSLSDALLEHLTARFKSSTKPDPTIKRLFFSGRPEFEDSENTDP